MAQTFSNFSLDPTNLFSSNRWIVWIGNPQRYKKNGEQIDINPTPIPYLFPQTIINKHKLLETLTFAPYSLHTPPLLSWNLHDDIFTPLYQTNTRPTIFNHVYTLYFVYQGKWLFLNVYTIPEIINIFTRYLQRSKHSSTSYFSQTKNQRTKL